MPEESDFPPESEDFEIIESAKEEGMVFVSPDIATCPDCERELFDPANRRYLHPFINCTACGPRLTILDSMPYDRVRTSMGEFPMCEDCATGSIRIFGPGDITLSRSAATTADRNCTC